MNSKLGKENFIYNVAKTTNKVSLRIFDANVFGNVGPLSFEPISEGGGGGGYSPSLDFSEAQNSQYVPLV